MERKKRRCKIGAAGMANTSLCPLATTLRFRIMAAVCCSLSCWQSPRQEQTAHPDSGSTMISNDRKRRNNGRKDFHMTQQSE